MQGWGVGAREEAEGPSSASCLANPHTSVIGESEYSFNTLEVRNGSQIGNAQLRLKVSGDVKSDKA